MMDLKDVYLAASDNISQIQPLVEPLTERELEVLFLASKGETNAVIGAHLGISGRTVQGHLARIFKKLNVNTRTEAVMQAVALGLITPESRD